MRSDEIAAQAISDITIHSKYARYIPELGRRETWLEVVQRSEDMHVRRFPDLMEEIQLAFDLVRAKKVLPSMRTLQFAGKPIEISPNRAYNCAYCPVDSWHAFPEIMFLLLGGTGVGYSVQRHHVSQLPEVRGPGRRRRRYLIGDSIEGWADAVKVLVKSYFEGGPAITFDFSDIRPKGAMLVTSGGRAPGPQPLKDCLHNLTKVLDSVESGERLTPIQAHDMVCHIANAVLAGGIRRAALISLFSMDDEEMVSCKSGSWWELNPQRGRANNSAVILRHRACRDDFMWLWERIRSSGSGEPGIFLSHNMEWGTNPCCEISLRPHSFCNLTTVNVSDVGSQDEFEERVRAASLIGTLQAAYTDFHYLREVWKQQAEKDALIGVSLTGQASCHMDRLDLARAACEVVTENVRVAKLIGINPAARTTCTKPEGTSSLVAGTSSGIHAWHSKFYIRRFRFGNNESVLRYLVETIPDLVADDFERPGLQSVVSLPMKAPEGAIVRDEEGPIQLLERIRHVYRNWVCPGHVSGDNTHNVSATISVKDDEWDQVGDWMWENRDCYNGLSVLPYDGGTYVQPPFEACDEETYERLLVHVREIDLSQVLETEDLTDLKGEVACAGGSCEIVS